MNEPSTYTAYHPRWHRTHISTYWWMQRGSYLVFILRELSSIFVAWFVLFLLFLVRAVSQGESSYRQFLEWSCRPFVVLLNVISLLFIVFHAITWFNLAPKAMVVHVGRTRVPAPLIAASNYLAWAIASIVVVWLLVGG